jgi:spore coat protein A
MNSTRREFLRCAAATGIAAMVPWQRVFAQAQSPALRKFIQPLPALGTEIPLANSVPFLGGDYFQLNAGEYTQQLHPDLPKPTKLWGYADATTGCIAISVL